MADGINSPTDNQNFNFGVAINASGPADSTTLGVLVSLLYEDNNGNSQQVNSQAVLTNQGTANASWSSSALMPPLNNWRYLFCATFGHNPGSTTTIERFITVGAPV